MQTAEDSFLQGKKIGGSVWKTESWPFVIPQVQRDDDWSYDSQSDHAGQAWLTPVRFCFFWHNSCDTDKHWTGEMRMGCRDWEKLAMSFFRS